MIFTAFSNGRFDLAGQSTRCALGKGGTIAAARKREGDGCSPLGVWPLRGLLYRADRLDAAGSPLDPRPLAEHDGWCDAPNDPAYNQLVRHPYPASAEHLWRADHLYDLIFVLGYNDDPGKTRRRVGHLLASRQAWLFSDRRVRRPRQGRCPGPPAGG